MATVASLSIALHSIMPVSSVLLVVGSLITFNVMAVVAGAGVLTEGHSPEGSQMVRLAA